MGELLPEKLVGNDELQENDFYIGLENIKSNGVSEWLTKKNTRLVLRSLAQSFLA